MQVSDKFRIYGNTHFSNQPEVICVIDDPSIQLRNICLVNRIWDGHLVLVGDVPCGKKVPSSTQNMSCGLHVTQEVQGWDFHECHKIPDLIITFRQKSSNLKFLVKEINNKLHKKELSDLLGGETFKILWDLAFPKAKERARRKEIGHLLQNYTFEEATYRIQELIITAKRNLRISIQKTGREIFQKKQESLKRALELGLTTHQKVIVFVQSSHLNDRKMCEYLDTKKFVVIAAKELTDSFPYLKELQMDT